MGGFHFVVLDDNYMKVNGEYIAYEQNAKTPGILPYISQEQLDWLEKDLANTKYPNLCYVFPYKEAVFGIITIDDENIIVKGTQSEFAGKGPEEMGVIGGVHARSGIYPKMSDRVLPIKKN